MRTLVLLLGLALSACAPPIDKKPSQDEATMVVWDQTYGQVGAAPPEIMWVDPPNLNCSEGRGWDPMNPEEPPCVAGLFFDQYWEAQVAWPAATTSFSTTAFAHELCHAFSWKTTGSGDGDHVGPCFQPGGYVDMANTALLNAGL